MVFSLELVYLAVDGVLSGASLLGWLWVDGTLSGEDDLAGETRFHTQLCPLQ